MNAHRVNDFRFFLGRTVFCAAVDKYIVGKESSGLCQKGDTSCEKTPVIKLEFKHTLSRVVQWVW